MGKAPKESLPERVASRPYGAWSASYGAGRRGGSSDLKTEENPLTLSVSSPCPVLEVRSVSGSADACGVLPLTGLAPVIFRIGLIKEQAKSNSPGGLSQHYVMGEQAEALAAVPTAVPLLLRYDLSGTTPWAEHILSKELTSEELSKLGFRRNLTECVHIPHSTRYVTTGSDYPQENTKIPRRISGDFSIMEMSADLWYLTIL